MGIHLSKPQGHSDSLPATTASISVKVLDPYYDIDCLVISDLKKNLVKTCGCSTKELCSRCPYKNQQCRGCGLCDLD